MMTKADIEDRINALFKGHKVYSAKDKEEETIRTLYVDGMPMVSPFCLIEWRKPTTLEMLLPFKNKIKENKVAKMIFSKEELDELHELLNTY